MGNKITLTYENGEFNVALNENVVYTDKEMEGALLKFNAVVKNNAIEQSNSWCDIEDSIKAFNISNIEVNSQFKTISYGKMKYFYNTDKVFYIENSSMISLGGGSSLFNFVIDKINSGELENEESFLELCKIAMVNKGIFSAHEVLSLVMELLSITLQLRKLIRVLVVKKEALKNLKLMF